MGLFPIELNLFCSVYHLGAFLAVYALLVDYISAPEVLGADVPIVDLETVSLQHLVLVLRPLASCLLFVSTTRSSAWWSLYTGPAQNCDEAVLRIFIKV